MKILYVFPHPDDESFGPAAAIAQQVSQGHQVFLLTLTKGGATKARLKLGYSIEQMGRVRYAEMQQVARVLGLSELTVLDFPDSGLKELDPRELELAIKSHVQRISPHVLVSYPVHGISGFHDHLIAHHLVKRVFLELKDSGHPQRLAFYTLTQAQAEKAAHHKLSFSTEDEIDCIINVRPRDIDRLKEALNCYETYQDMIEKTGVKKLAHDKAHFEIFQEDHQPVLSDLFAGLQD